jgi:hypothetical protein
MGSFVKVLANAVRTAMELAVGFDSDMFRDL